MQNNQDHIVRYKFKDSESIYETHFSAILRSKSDVLLQLFDSSSLRASKEPVLVNFEKNVFQRIILILQNAYNINDLKERTELLQLWNDYRYFGIKNFSMWMHHSIIQLFAEFYSFICNTGGEISSSSILNAGNASNSSSSTTEMIVDLYLSDSFVLQYNCIFQVDIEMTMETLKRLIEYTQKLNIHTIHYLYFSHCNLYDDMMTVFFQFLQSSCNQLIALDLSLDNNLSGSSFEQLLSVLLMIDHYSLYSLNCSHNFINDKAVSVLLNELQEGSFPSLKMVDISYNLLTNYIIHTIYSVLYIEKKNPFEIFNISGNRIGEEALNKYLSIFQDSDSNSMTSLSFENIPLYSSSVSILSKELATQSFKHLQSLSLKNCHLTISLFSLLFLSLEKNSLHTLILDENSLSMETMRVFHTMILHQSFQHLRYLSLQNTNLTSKELCLFVDAIELSPFSHLLELNINNNSINDEGLQELFEALDRRCYSSLLSLHLSNTNMGPFSLCSLSNCFRNQHLLSLTTLDLSKNNRLTSVSLCSFLNTLLEVKHNRLSNIIFTNIRVGSKAYEKYLLLYHHMLFPQSFNFNSANTYIGNKGVLLLFNLLITTVKQQVTTLNLSGANMNDDLCSTIAPLLLLNQFKSLTHLDLSKNHISDKGFLSLYPSLLTMNLISLNLSNLLLTKQSILYMCEHPIKSLQYLYLDNLNMNDEILPSFHTFLAILSNSIHTLSITNNAFTSSLFHSLSSTSFFYSISVLHLENNQCSDESLLYLSQILQYKTSKITELYLDNNQITYDGIESLVSLLKTDHLSSLSVLSLKNNPIYDEGISLLYDTLLHLNLPHLKLLNLQNTHQSPHHQLDIHRLLDRYPSLTIK